jgi:hypothetical protein
MSRFLALLIISSFAVAVLPIDTSAEESMPCCAGKSAEHCDSGLTAPKPRPVITEPMCGLTWSPPSAGVKPVTDPVAVESTAVEQDCEMDCGACAAVASRHKQKDLVAERTTYHTPAPLTARFAGITPFYSSNENWTRINPRGPPARA